MNDRLLAVCGTLAPLLYAFTVIFGGAITPSYSHVASATSELIQSGAPHKTLLDPLFVVYDILLVLFAVGLYRVQNGRRSCGAGVVILAITGRIGVVMTLFFPQDPRGTPSRSLV